MTTNGVAGRKRTREESSVPEPQTPSKTRHAARIANTPFLTPEAKRRRREQIAAALVSNAPAVTAVPVQNAAGTTTAHAGSSAQGAFRPAAPMPGITDALLNAARASSPPPAGPSSTSNAVQDEEEEFWLSTPVQSQPVARPPRGDFCAAGYHPEATSNAARALVKEDTAVYWDGMPTPPPSSPNAERDGSPSSTAQVSQLLRCSQSSTAQVSQMLRFSQSSGSSQPRENNLMHDPANPFDLSAENEPKEPRASQPIAPAQPSRVPALRSQLEALLDLPAYIRKLERKDQENVASLLEKDERIRELEAQVEQLNAKCWSLEAALQTRR